MDDDTPDDRTPDVATAGPPTGGRIAPSGAFAPDALAGQVVLVTGASQGIGASVAMAAAAAGADVAIGCHRHTEAAEAVGARVRDAGATAEVFAADLADRAQARGLVHRTLEAFGRIDGLVNNAGIMPSSPFLETTDQEWDTVIETD
ncbi:MAG TPA: SDR family NAD(P)-dependent oxidoreductase, partial [Euzebya sp.]|nr:SDR family NAD(P)-dependent oxidoreductase [Euzebya sp.]